MTDMHGRLITLITAAALVLFSCGDSNIFDTFSDSENTVVLTATVSDGDVIDPASYKPIELGLEYDEAVVHPTRLEISIENSKGEEIGSPRFIEGDDLNGPLPSISLADPEDGLYTVYLRLYDSSDILLKEEAFRFFFAGRVYRIHGIDLYPGTVRPGGYGLLIPDIEAPDDSWLRWSLDNAIISEGYLSDYTEGLRWKAPEAEGVYSLRLELFPKGPSSSNMGAYDFISELKNTIEIYVSDAVVPRVTDLGPEESYSALLHLDGVLEDRGYSGFDVTPIGDPLISRKYERLGYWLDGVSGFRFSGNILPVRNGSPQPFSITFSYHIEDIQIEKSFIEVSGKAGFGLEIKSDISGSLTAEIKTPAGTLVEYSGIFPQTYNEITCSVVPGQDSVLFMWYCDGILESVNEHMFSFEMPDSDYTSLIGGESGFEGLLDEFGVYCVTNEKPDIDDNIFYRKAAALYNPEKIIACYGFDGLRFYDSPERELSLLNGNLVLEPEGEFRLFSVESSFSSLGLEFDFSRLSQDTRLVVDNGNGRIREIYLNSIAGDSEKFIEMEFTVNPEEETLNILTGKEFQTSLGIDPGSKIDLILINYSETESVELASFLAVKESRKIVNNVEPLSGTGL